MEEGMDPLIIKHVWSATDGQSTCQIAWTTEQLLRIEQAVKAGDDAFLAIVEEAMRRALDAALTRPQG